MQNPTRRAARPLLAMGVAVAVMVSAAPPVSAAAGLASEPTPAASCQQVTSCRELPEVVRVDLGQGALMEKLSGEAALTHLYNLFSRRPAAFRAAREAMTKRGLRPTDHVYVERTVRLASNRSGAADAAPSVRVQDYSEQNSDGEVVFWSWDDGDDNTWEGAIYMEVYGSGDASTWEGRIDASNEDHEWIYYQKTWNGPGGGGGPIEARFGAPPLPTPARAAVTFTSGVAATPYGGYTPVVNWISWAKCWRACSVGGCAAAALGCIASGPFWPACFGWGCNGILVGCGITCALS